MKEEMRKAMKAGSFREKAIVEQRNLNTLAHQWKTCFMVHVASTTHLDGKRVSNHQMKDYRTFFRLQNADAGRMTTQLGTPRGRYDEYSSKYSLSKKPRFIDPVGKSQTREGDAC
jgi:hypothetical protein